ncbi:Ig-like domain-containing protein [candidate division KSB1 bacterium]|nr:Ig-like domain-containing protein [candidate division KSB1 bacterium]
MQIRRHSFFFALISIIIFYPLLLWGQQDLSGISICLDPGHSRTDNAAVYNYSEAEEVLRTAWALKDFLMQMNPDTIVLTRNNDTEIVELSQRTDLANRLGVTWFHSVHSDAGQAELNHCMLIYGQSQAYQVRFPGEADVMSKIMVDDLSRTLRIPKYIASGYPYKGAYPDWTLYNDIWNWPRTLHVLHATDMPAELSEQGFHTNYEQGARNLNSEFKRMMAIPFYLSMLEYWQIPIPPVNTLAGYISDEDNGRTLNGVSLTLSDGQSYTTDTYASLFHLYSMRQDSVSNGFYYFENVPSGSINLSVSVGDYYDTTLNVAISDTFITFQDIQLISSVPPYVKNSRPAHGDTATSILESIRLSFSREMDAQSVENAISIEPAIEGQLKWYNENHYLHIVPSKPLPLDTQYTLTIGIGARDVRGHPIDGNQDGTGGDPYTLSFKTSAADLFPPVVIDTYPANKAERIQPDAILTAIFNEPLNPETITASTVYVVDEFQDEHAGVAQYYTVNNKGIISYFPEQPLYPNAEFQLYFERGIEDINGNPLAALTTVDFATGDDVPLSGVLDNFDSGVHLWQFGDSTSGIELEQTLISSDSLIRNLASKSTHSMAVQVRWGAAVQTGLVDLSFDQATARRAVFDSTAKLQAWLFGDGSMNLFRFLIYESRGSIEVSPWILIDWLGWRPISWDLASEAPGEWLPGSDGQLSGALTLAGMQLGRTDSSGLEGTLYLDDLRVLGIETGIAESSELSLPTVYELNQNYPNPFNPKTRIMFELPQPGRVTIAIYNVAGQLVDILVDEFKMPGIHCIEWDGTSLLGLPVGSGVYFVKMRADGYQGLRKMILMH